MYEQKTSIPIWRSMLFVPANSKRFISKAHTRGADAIVLDLEDSVPPTQKVDARQLVANSINGLYLSGCDVLVRINDPLRLAVPDLEAVVVQGIQAIVVPKASSACQLQRLSTLLETLELERGIEHQIQIIAQIETLDALHQLDEIAAVPRVVGISLGTEDFSAAAGMATIPEALMGPSQALLFAARRQGCVPYGFVASIADYSDLDAFADTIAQARKLGFYGAFAIHPGQVAVMNKGFLPTEQELALAQRITTEFEHNLTQGFGTFTIDGKMIDKPVVEQALQQLTLAKRFS